ncbi:MAG: hypothetical protein JNL89_03495, partial [Rhodanobacteraceae bacterium]|nr:hypothetical protein [Rhodanobacteraceae bacterium]
MRLSNLFLALIFGGAAAATPPPAGLDLPALPQTAVLQFDALDRAKIDLEDLRAQDRPAPFRYALAHPVDTVKLGAEDNRGGHWSQLPDGRWLWRLPIRADDAVSIDLYFKRWRLPQGA